MAVRILAVAFAGFLVLIVVLANQGRLYDYVPDPTQYPGGDKICHFFLMGTMAMLANMSFYGAAIPFGRRRIFLGSALVFLFVAGEEFSQLYVEGRSFDWVDLTADVLGIMVLGSLGGRLAVKKRMRKKIRPVKVDGNEVSTL